VNNEIINKLNSFASISLGDLEVVALMKRVDNKYFFKAQEVPVILDFLKDKYWVLQIDDIRAFTYSSLYYDTPDLHFYYNHHRGKQNRWKVRERKYVDSGLSFFEIKFKNNKGLTTKQRISVPDITGELDGNRWDFLQSVMDKDTPDQLQPVLWVNYTRITLVSKEKNERATLDLNLEFEFEGKRILLDHLAILESKRESTLRTSPLIDFLKTRKIQPQGFSKYCTGMAMLNPEYKQNNFKKRLRSIDKLKVA
jgi:hypothetical protein